MMRIPLSRNQTTALSLAAVLAVTFLSFLPVLTHSIEVWDDLEHIKENMAIRSLSMENVLRMFREAVCNTYIPLSSLSFAVDHFLSGFDPWTYHLHNLLLHLGVTALVFAVCRQLGASRGAALAASLLFGIHPLHVESVAWATERKDVLYAAFYLLAVNRYLVYLRTGRKRAYVLALVAGLLSILSKAMALSLPLVLLLLDWFLERPRKRTILIDKIPFFLYIVPIAWITYSLNARGMDIMPVPAALTWVYTFMFYPFKFFLPINLLPLYALPKPVALTSAPYLLSLLGMALLIIAVFRSRNRTFRFAVLYYVLSIFFLMRFDDSVDVTVVADRFMYLPCLGLCFALGVGLAKLLARLKERQLMHYRSAVTAVLAVFLALSLMTFRQSRLWKDDYSLWKYVLTRRSDSDLAHVSFGQALYERGEGQQALSHYLAALKINPLNHKANNNVGEVLYQSGRKDEALQMFEMAVRGKPDYPEGLNNLGVMSTERGRYDAASFYIREAIRNKPENPTFYLSLGDLFAKQGLLSQALGVYEDASNRGAPGALVENRVGVIYLKMGDRRSAIEHFQRALAIDPANQNARHNLRSVLAQQSVGQDSGYRLRGQRWDGLNLRDLK